MRNAILILTLCACDPVQEVGDATFREIDEVLVVNQWLTLEEFTELVLACDGLEKIKATTTLTAYLPENALSKSQRVVGLGVAFVSWGEVHGCLREHMLDLGATLTCSVDADCLDGQVCDAGYCG